jgi:hypothetical protein
MTASWSSCDYRRGLLVEVEGGVRGRGVMPPLAVKTDNNENSTAGER